jgi:hypothetical protein
MPYKDPEVRKAKHAEYSKAYYEKNKKEVIRKVRARRKAHKEWFVSYKEQLSCTICGESRPAALDFHHVTPVDEDQKVNELVKDGHCWPKIMREIEKCIVLCANCHRIHHYDERQEKKNKKLATSLK